MKNLSQEILLKRSQFLKSIRKFFESHNVVEVDTPILKQVVSMEPYLDPFLVSSPDNREKGYLITSPEYSHKQYLAKGLERIYEISHVFRSGEIGSGIHSAEFLLLEFYLSGFRDQDLMEFCKNLLDHLSNDCFQKALPIQKKISLEDLFVQFTTRGFDRESLEKTILEKNILISSKNAKSLESETFEDLFHLVFLNCIELHLKEKEEILYLYDFPKECAALSKVENGKAKRFEIYWQGLELANAFEELTDAKEQRSRLESEQAFRKKLGKEIFPIDEDFLEALSSETFPKIVSGIAIGLDRLFMKFLSLENLQFVSPYYRTLS